MDTKRTILIVDDDLGFRKTLSDILKVKGYVAVAVDKGITALDKIKVEKPVVALIDLKLEDMSGLDLLEKFREQDDGIECILLTGHATQKSAIEAVNLGAYGYIPKPYDVEQLLMMIRRAVEKQEAQEALRAYAQRLTTLREIDQAILEAQSSQDIAKAALNHIRYLVPCQQASVTTYDLETNQFTMLANYTGKIIILGTNEPNTLGGLPGPAELEKGQVRLMADISNLPDPTPFEQTLQTEGIRTYITVPLMSQNELIGTLNLGAKTVNAFVPDHIEIAQEAASQLAVAIQQARLHEQVQHHATELEQRVAELQLAQTAEREQRELAETLREVTSMLNYNLDREQVLPVILEQLARVVEYDSASVMLVSGDRLDTVARQSLHPQHKAFTSLQIKTLPHVQDVLEKQIPVIISNTKTDPHWSAQPGINYVRCWLGVPLVVQDQVIGLLNLNKEQANFYTPFDAELTAAFADQAAIAVKNADLFEQAQQEISERMRAEFALEAERASLAQRVEERTAELKAVNAELARAARLKDEFLASMSHELRTPLNAILGLSEALQEQVYGVLNEKQDKTLHTIEESGRHLLSLINDVLDISKIEAGKLTLHSGSIAVETICQASLRLIKQTALKKKIKVSYTLDPQITTIQADQRRLKQILVNLLSNAVKFTPEGGAVGLNVEPDPEDHAVRFIIWDTGIGIAPEDMDQLFQPFVQLDSSLARQHSGTGLGLGLVSRLTKLHNGGISVESEPGMGSRFIVSLPLKESSDGIDKSVKITHETAVGGNVSTLRQVLVIEDSSAAADQLTRYLAEWNIKSIIYTQGSSVLDGVRTIQPDAIILDILLPDISGWDILAQLQQDIHTKNIPVLIVSVVDDYPPELTVHAAEYLVKPISRKQLQKALIKVLPYELEEREGLMTVSQQTETNDFNFPAEKLPLVLIAENNPNNIDTISDYLEIKGYRTVVAFDGAEAVARAKETKPDAILMDIQMPGMDGLEATRRIRQDINLAAVPIIALTALAMPGDRERCLQAGVNEYLSKPLSLKKLVTVIETQLKQTKSEIMSVA